MKSIVTTTMITIGNRDNRIIERSVYMGDSIDHLLLNLLARFLLSHAYTWFLLSNGTTRTFPRARICPATLSTYRQTTTMTNTPVCTEIHQPLDVH